MVFCVQTLAAMLKEIAMALMQADVGEKKLAAAGRHDYCFCRTTASTCVVGESDSFRPGFAWNLSRATLQHPVKQALTSSRNFAEVKIVKELRDNIKNRVNLEMMAAGYNKKRIVQAAVFEELVEMLTPARKPFVVSSRIVALRRRVIRSLA